MLSLTDLKPGTYFLFEGSPHVVVAAEHSKHGRGGAILRTKLRNLLTGAIFDRTLKGSDRFDEADVTRQPVQILFADTSGVTVMNMTSFDQAVVAKDLVGSRLPWVKEGLEAILVTWNDRPLDLELPIKVPYVVTYTEPGFRGDTQSSVLKPAQLETGATIQVPLFVKTNDQILVDTRTGSYIERVKGHQ